MAKREENPSILSKAFTILDAFTEADRVLTLTDLSRKTGLPKSTVHRLIQRLMELDALEEHVHGYRLGVRFLRQTSSMPVESLREVALLYMAKLSEWTKSTVHLGVLREENVVILQALYARERAYPVGAAGKRIPSRFSAMGRAMMAYLPEEEVVEVLQYPQEPLTRFSQVDDEAVLKELSQIAKVGFAVQRSEITEGVGNVAVPILVKQKPVGAIAVQIPETTEVSERLVNALKVTARRIAVELRAVLADGRGELFPSAD